MHTIWHDMFIMTINILKKLHKKKTEKSTFHLFRWFYMISVAAIMVILVVACIGLRGIFRGFVLREAERDAERLSYALRDCEVKEFISIDNTKEQSLSIPAEEISKLDHEMQVFLAPFGVVKIKIFDAETRIIYSTDSKIIGKLNPDNTKLAKALSGTIVSKYETKEHVWDLEDEKHYEVGIVETYVPIYSRGGGIVGSFEIYKNVTEDLIIADRISIHAGSILFVTVVTVFTVLMFVIYCASKAIKSNTHDLGERIKELNCLYSCIKLVDRHDSLEEIFQGTAELIPPGWQYPEITVARITVEGRQFETSNFHKTDWIQSADIKVHGQKAGSIEVCYLKKISVVDEGPFLKEERSLINALAERIGRVIDHKQAEEEKKKLEEQLRQTQKMEAIGTLAGGIAHDFNNVLGSIIGYADLAMDDIQEGTIARSNLEQVLIAGSRAKQLIKQILTFSRKAEEGQKLIQVAPVIEESLKMLRASIPSTIEIRQNIESQDGIISGNPTQIHQVVINLCTNAAHAMGENGGVLKVGLEEVSIDSDIVTHYGDLKMGQYLKLTIKDTGCGIERDAIDRVFEPFFTTKDVDKGTGMGLSVVHGIVKDHNGTITVESQPQKGTTFNVFLPKIGSGDLPEDELPEIPRGQGELILLVDDDPSIVGMMTQVLERLGYSVTAKTSSIDAVETFTTEPGKFDLVITDYAMPGMTGKELAQEVMNVRPDIPVVLCTGFSEDIDAKDARRMGIKDFVMKPVTREKIAAIIRKILDEKEIAV